MRIVRMTILLPALVGWLATAASAQDKYMGGTLALAPGISSAGSVVIYMCPVEPNGREACEQALAAAVDVDDGWGTFSIGPIPDLNYSVYAWRDVDGDRSVSVGDEWAIFNIYPNDKPAVTPPTNGVALRLRRFDGSLQSVLIGKGVTTQSELINTRPETILGRFVLGSSPYDTVNASTGTYLSTNFSSHNLMLNPDGTFEKTSVFNNGAGCSVFSATGRYAINASVIRFTDRTQQKKNWWVQLVNAT